MIQTIAAVSFLSMLGLLLMFSAGYLLWRSPYSISQSLVYCVNVLVTRLLWRTTINRMLPIPVGQGAVIVANHRSSVDPCFVQLTAGRVVHWMVARDFVKNPILGWLIRFCQSIPARRGGFDTAATKAAIRLAKNGGVVGIFPEGRINRSTDFMLPVRPGAAMIALKAGVPIIPCHIEGSPYDGTPAGALRMTARVRVTVGEPLRLERYAGQEHDRAIQAIIIRECVSALAKLAKCDDTFSPKLAGKRWMDSEPIAEPDRDPQSDEVGSTDA